MTVPVDLDALERWLEFADGPSHYRLLAALPSVFAELRAARACIKAADAMRQDGFMPAPNAGLAAVKLYDAARAAIAKGAP